MIPPKPLSLLGAPINPVSERELLEILLQWSESCDQPRRMYYANAHTLNISYSNPSHREHLAAADLVICEGRGALWGGRIAGTVFPEQLATMDWFDSYLAGLRMDPARLYLVGDEVGVAQACAEEIERRHPHVRVVGTHHGFFPKVGAQSRRLVAEIHASRADVVMVGMSSPDQEAWIEANFESMGAQMVFALGAMFRWYSGVESRAPKFMRDAGLEWLARLVKHPRRHFNRYIVGIPVFIWRCFSQRFRAPTGP